MRTRPWSSRRRWRWWVHTVIGAVEEGDELLLWRVRCWWWWWWWWLLWTVGSTLTTSSTKFLESWWLRKADCSKFRPRGIIPPPLRAAAVGVVDPNCSIPTSVATVLPYPTGASGTAKICSKKSSPNPSEVLLPAISNNHRASVSDYEATLLLYGHLGFEKHGERKTRKVVALSCCGLWKWRMVRSPRIREWNLGCGFRECFAFGCCPAVEFEKWWKKQKKGSGRIGFGSGLLWMGL